MGLKYSRHLPRILRGVEKNSRQPEFELKIRPSKLEVITGSQGMVKNTFQERGKGASKLKPSHITKKSLFLILSITYLILFT